MENQLLLKHLLTLPPTQFLLVEIEILQETLHQSLNALERSDNLKQFFFRAAVLI